MGFQLLREKAADKAHPIKAQRAKIALQLLKASHFLNHQDMEESLLHCMAKTLDQCYDHAEADHTIKMPIMPLSAIG
jgi:hypothetical protein